MPHFSKKSKDILRTCNPLLQAIFDTVIITYDCTILEGRRGKIRQNNLFASGASKVKWPNSKHNVIEPLGLSNAVDVAPYVRGISWNVKQGYHFGGYVLAVSHQLKIPIRWGGDWDKDHDVTDQSFNDLGHFELIL